MRSGYLHKWARVSVLIRLAIRTLNTYGNAQANGFCIIGFLRLEINLFSFVFFIFFFCSYFIGFQICSGRAWVDSKPSGRRGKF